MRSLSRLVRPLVALLPLFTLASLAAPSLARAAEGDAPPLPDAPKPPPPAVEPKAAEPKVETPSEPKAEGDDAKPTEERRRHRHERGDERDTPRNVEPEKVVAAYANNGNFMDTRLTWTFGDDDVLHRTGSTQPNSPMPSIGDRAQYRMFFDGLNSRFAGRENLAHLVLYKKLPSFIPHLDTEAALVLRFDMAQLASNTGSLNQALYDGGSYLRLFYETRAAVKGKSAREGVGVTFFPLDTDRFRLGYLYDISWGGTNQYYNDSIFPRLVGSAPGLKVQYDGPSGLYLFGGFKTAQILQVQTNLNPNSTSGNDVETVKVQETNYGFLGGGGIDAGDFVHFDAGAGYFQQGRFDFPDLLPPPKTDRQAPRVFTYGTSARVVLHHNMPTPQSVDFLLYRNDPSAPMVMFAQEKYDPNEIAFSVSLEASRLYQNLKDPNTVGGTMIQPATAGALQGVVKAGYARISLAAIVRDVPFILRNVPSLVPFVAIDPSTNKTQNETFISGSFDYYLESLHLRPGIGGGVQLPATATVESNVGSAPANRTTVIMRQGQVSVLPVNDSRRAIVQTRLSLRWDLSPAIAAIAWLQLVHDPNRTLIARDPTEGSLTLRTFQDANYFGFGTTVQARF
jgi:hypothetical protein